MGIEGPVILDEFSDFSGCPSELTCALKCNFLSDGAVLPQHLDGTRESVSRVRPARDIHADFERMAAMPGFVRKLERRADLELVRIPGPRIEEVPAPTVRRNQHVFRSLTVRVAVESGVAKDRVQESTGTQLVAVRDPEGNSILSIVGRSGLWNQRVDICELPSQRKNVEIYIYQVARRHNHLEFRKRSDTSCFCFVDRPRQPAH